ncbi:MAG: amidohydrolase [Acidiphilium sp. 34-60-192]|nr:MAG: amidohydrolase [Acidiphilium sp. 34-60-192]
MDSLLDTLTPWRHHLHRHPELSCQEQNTAQFVCARLGELGIPFEAGIGGHGVVASLRRGGNRSVGLRADMDALPIHEATGASHASTNPGVMHACGHDGHTVSLLGAAMLLRDDPSWSGTVHLLFQPAEEGFGGAQAMIDDGVLTRFPMERIFGYHNWPGLDAGTIALRPGPLMAQGARLAITIHGHGGHAAMPDLTHDPVVCAGHILVALQTVVSADADNQIPETVALRGTFRAMRPAVFDAVAARIQAVITNTALALGCTATVVIERGVAATINDPTETARAQRAARALGLPLREDIPPTMASEDFGAFLQTIPGAYAWIGNGPATDGQFLHNDKYDFNDAILPLAATYLAQIARDALAASA